MPSFCAVLDCCDKYGHGKNVPFHKFPTKNRDLLEKWIAFTQRSSDWRPSKWMSICGLHFRDEDYRCLEQKKLLKKQAIPLIHVGTYSNVNRNVNKTTTINNLESDEESSNCDIDESGSKNNKIGSNCRFCGFTTSTFVTFAGNFEIFGFIQKCLPTLSIRQDDNLPKEICQCCLKRLKKFAAFIDKVLETQVTLQRQYRTNCPKPASERILKIKQEPVVRVKQENLDDVNAFFPDEVYDGYGCGEQEHDASNANSQLDQKFQFCDFPVLNDQDIINNCDIMEIINLSDPFIDITNCENTIAEEDPTQQHQFWENRVAKQQTLPEILQTYFLNEEHNYANLAEDLKEEWPTQNYYKTEKVEADECEDNFNMESIVIDDEIEDINSSFAEDDTEVAATMTITTSIENDNNDCSTFGRSNKPIVTSVSSFNEANLLPITQTAQTISNSNLACQPIASRKKPNIVVLNESIVQSSHAIQFQACTICQSKFFSIDSLNHHYGIAHNLQITTTTSDSKATQPMVIVPSSNIVWNESTQPNTQYQNNCYKAEKDNAVEAFAITDQSAAIATQALIKRSAKNEIKILDMQQTFLQHQYHYPNQIQNNDMFSQMPASGMTEIQKAQQFEQSIPYNTEDQQQFTAVTVTKKKNLSIPKDENESICPQQQTPHYSNASHTNSKSIITYETVFDDERPTMNAGYLEKIASDYFVLQKRYHRLKQKCWNLVHTAPPKKRQRRFRCRICSSAFFTIFQLIRHKQSTPSHYVRKPKSHFSASCAGCEKYFCRKIAFHNHMRYICQALPLRWLKNQIRTFKCRYCRRITFTHWRLCRKHELKCRYRKKHKKTFKYSKSLSYANKARMPKKARCRNVFRIRHCQPKRVNKTSKGPHECDKCQKVYATLSGLNQHRITHTTLRNHQCDICYRIFKRRNGLAQHVKGFHMKLKPYECPTCKHCYALKGDMRRCKHSALTRKVMWGTDNKTLQFQ